VSVSVQLTNDYISIKVADNGMGVSKDNLQRLFDRFYRVDSTGSRKYGGTGLGLSIAKELTEIQGGTISVASVLGKGTEFVVTIPKAEKTYRETLAAIQADAPRHEIVYENAESYLLAAADEIDIPIQELSELTPEQFEDLLSYLLSMPKEEEEIDYSIVLPSELLPARYEAAKRARIPKEKTAANHMREDATIPHKRSSAANSNREDSGSGNSFSKPQAESRSAVRRAAMEATGENSAQGETRQISARGDKPARPQTTKVSKPKLPDTAADHKIITIEQLQSESLKGETNA
jgi:hypothetical protein